MPTLLARLLDLSRSRIARDSGVVAASQFGAAIAGFLTTLVGARMLGPIDYGVAVLIVTFPELILSMATVRSATITTKYLSTFIATREPAKGAAVCKLGYGIDFLAALLASCVVLLAILLFASASVPKQLEWLVAVYALSFLISSLGGTNGAILQSCGEFRWLGAVQLTNRILVLGVSFLVLHAGWGVTGFVLAAATGPVASGVFGGVVAYALLRKRGFPFWFTMSLDPVWGLLKELRSVLGWNYLAATWTGLLAQGPVLMLGWMRGPVEAGYYQLSATIANVASYPESAMAQVTYPVLSTRFATGNLEGLRQTIRRWTIKGGLTAGGFVLAGLLLAPVVIPVIYGREYFAVAWITQLLLVGTAVSATFFWLNGFFYAAGRIRLWTLAFGVYVVAVLAFGFPAISIGAALGMAVVAGIGKAGYSAVMARRVQRQLKE